MYDDTGRWPATGGVICWSTLAGRADQRFADARLVQRPPVGQGHIGVGELQRRHEVIALADRGDRGEAGLPDVTVPAVLVLDLLDVGAVGPAVLAPVLALIRVVFPVVVEPFPGRDGAGGLLGQVDTAGLAEAPVQRHLLHFLDRRLGAGDHVGAPVIVLPHLVAQVVVHGVAGLDQRLGERHLAVVRRTVVDVIVAADVHRRRAVVLAVERVAVGDRRGGGGHLPGGARVRTGPGWPSSRRAPRPASRTAR